MGILGILFVGMFFIKVADIKDISWWLVFTPLMISVGIHITIEVIKELMYANRD